MIGPIPLISVPTRAAQNLGCATAELANDVPSSAWTLVTPDFCEIGGSPDAAGARRWLFAHPNHLSAHGAERGRVVPHHADRVRRAGDLGGDIAVVSGARRTGADRGLGPDAVGQCR